MSGESLEGLRQRLEQALKAIGDAGAFMRTCEWNDSYSQDCACDARHGLDEAEKTIQAVLDHESAPRCPVCGKATSYRGRLNACGMGLCPSLSKFLDHERDQGQRQPSAWSEFGDGHDYSRTGKHDPLHCRHCLRAQGQRISELEQEVERLKEIAVGFAKERDLAVLAESDMRRRLNEVLGGATAGTD